jgi:succinate dehydrogenase / fumarate reductase cytochrome b subunit
MGREAGFQKDARHRMDDIRKAQMIGRTSAAGTVQRPLSPHLQVYRWPPTMLASILNRATGVALSMGSLLLVWWVVALASGPEPFDNVESFIRSPLGLLMMLGWTVSLFYHLFSGIRHLVWDQAKLLAKPSLNPGTYVVFGLCIAATALVWLAAYLNMEG